MDISGNLKSNKKILAIDQSSRCSGQAYFEDSELKEYGKIVTDQEDLGERLYTIREEVKSLIQKYSIDEVIIEDIQLQNNVGNNVQTFKILAEVYGVLEELIKELNLPFKSVLASSWKSTLKIKGRNRPEQKRNAQEYVINNYGCKPIQDICDAICIGTHVILGGKEIVDHDWS